LTDLLLSPGFVGFLTNSCFSFADTIQGGSGIGKEIGYTFAESGAKGVLFADINATEAAEESKALSQLAGFKAISVELDVTNAASVQKAVDLAVEEFGAIDYCINSAGVHSGLLQHVESSTNQ
jgi:NAD(P)-dependent dehydrogenase (short-subunit alcohol dehydrogenase family)